MLKKPIIVLLVALVILNVNMVLAYNDVEGHWAEQDITKLSLNGIISGYEDGSFKPNANISRAELVTIINRMLGNSVENTRYVPDIATKNWYYKEIRKGIESGFVKGDEQGYVRPQDNITREEAVVMLQRAFVPAKTETIVTPYTDFDEVSSWAKDSFSTFITNRYISGYADQTVKPKANITRAELVKIITRMIGEYISFSQSNIDFHSNVIVNANKVTLSNVTIDGNLIICEGADNLTLENVLINGDFILRREIEKPLKSFKVEGITYNINTEPEVDNSKYSNDEYGISFSIPTGFKVLYTESDNTKVDLKKQNIIMVKISEGEDLYFKSFSQGLNEEKNRYAIPYQEVKQGYIYYYKYAIYGSERDSSYFLYLKRDNVEYTIYFYNIENINILESVADSIVLYDGTKMTIHERKTYNNPQLSLKFSYIDYVLVDDSYNTGVINEDEALYKLFIQVTNIIDMSNYTIEQLKTILVGLEDVSAEIVDSQITKVYTYDAIEYTVRYEGKLTKSLYIVMANKLYHFVFTAEEEKMNGAGVEIYKDILNNIEFLSK